MPEEYAGVRFKAMFEGVDFNCAKERKALVDQLSWMNKAKLLHGIPGNVSVRAAEGLVITPTGKNLAKVTEADMVLVRGVNEENKIVQVAGRLLPSSEAMMHWLIYENFPSANAIVHFHDDNLLKSHARFTETDEEHPYGTPELAHAALKALRKSKFIILAGHGGMAIGKDFSACNALIGKALKSIK